MALSAFGLALQIAVAPYATMPGANVAPNDAVTDSLRRMETRFLVTWRREWMLARRPSDTYLRLASLHCHNDRSWKSGSPNIILSERSRRSFCPIWFPVDDSLPSSESRGVDAALSDESRALMRRARGQLIERFATAAALHPDNPWIAGQLVRLHVDQNDLPHALQAARACAEPRPWCLLLEGFVRHTDGRSATADSLFARAVAAMNRVDRCQWTSVARLLDDRVRASYERIPCANRDTIDATFWWLADPLYLEAGNERRSEHFARQVLVRLRAALTIDERWDWRARYGGDALATMIIRYGWPTYLHWAGFREDGGHFEWLGFRDSAVNVAPEYALPRLHTTPPWRAVLDPSTLRAGDWSRFAPRQGYGAVEWENDDWPAEHFARRSGPVVELADQTVLFRRDHNALLAIGMDVPQRFFAPGTRAPYDAAVIGARDAHDRWTPARTSILIDGMSTTALVSPISAHAQIVSAEIMPADGADGLAGRARRAVHPPAPLSVLQPGDVAISDPLFFRPSDDAEPPSSTAEAISRMYGSLTLSGRRIGVFWETYGVPPTDTVDMTLRLTNETRPGLLRRLGTSLRVIGPVGGGIAVSWREAGAPDRAITYAGDVAIQTRSMVLDISRIKPGRYTIDITMVRRDATSTTRREITIER